MVISSDLFIRNYVETDALDDLLKNYDTHFLVSSEVKGAGKIRGEIAGVYSPDPAETKKHFELFNVLSWRYRRKSSSFAFRIKRIFGLNVIFPAEFGFYRKCKRLLGLLARWLARNFWLVSAGNSLAFPHYFSWKKSTLVNYPDMERMLRDCQPDLVVFPASAYDPDGNVLLSICQKGGWKTLFLIDNWDNLSSKSILWIKPDALAVWGPQSAEHAERIQDIPPDKVHLIGTPRFDIYFKTRDLRLVPHFTFPYILFVGTSLPFDEIGALDIMNKVILDNPCVFGETKIVYRPHPWRLGSDLLEAGTLEKVLLDPQVSEAYLNESKNVSFQPSIDYYPSLLGNAEFVTGGLTSMLIEAMIFRKTFLAIVYDDGKNLTSPDKVMKSYTHFQGIEAIPSVKYCKNKGDLAEDFLECWISKSSFNHQEIDKSRSYFLYHDEKPYRARLNTICQKVLGAGV